MGIKKFYLNLLEFRRREKFRGFCKTFELGYGMAMMMKNLILKHSPLFCSLILLFAVFASASSGRLTFLGPNENEAFAIESMKKIVKLQKQYAKKNGGKFAPNFDELIASENPDASFTGTLPFVQGYVFTMRTEEANGEKPAFYTLNADPEMSEGAEKTGTRHFYYDSATKSIKFTTENRPAKAYDQAL